MPNGTVNNPKVFVSIGKDGIVSIVAARAEMGTGAARTALPMIVADEMEADWARVRIVQSPGDEKAYGNQDTDGSRSVRHFIQPMRQCGAAARAMLEAAAAKKWSVAPSEVEARLHEVVHKPSGRKLGYGELAEAAAAEPVPAADKIKLKEASAFRYIGKGNVPHCRSRRHHDRQGHVRSGRDAAGHEVCGDSETAGGRRQGRLAGCERGPEGAGRGEDRADRANAGSGQVRAARRRCGGRQGHLVGAQRAGRAQDHLGRRTQQGLRLQGLPRPARSRGQEARQGRAQRGRRRQGAGLRCQGDHSRVLRAAHRACHHGAAGGSRADDGRQVGGVGAGAEPRPGARRHRQGRRRQARGDGGAHHASRWRLRAQVQVRLRHRGGPDLQGLGRRTGEGGVDARGRPPARLLPHRDGRALRGGRRCRQQGGRVAASQRGTDDPVDVRARSQAPLRHRAGPGLCRYPVQRAQHPPGERRGAEPRADRLVPVGQQRGARLVDPVLHCRDGASARPRSEGLPLGDDRAGADRRSEQVGHHQVVELR